MSGHREVPQNLRGTGLGRLRNSRNPFRITSLAGPHPLTSMESHPYKKTGGGGTLSSPNDPTKIIHPFLSESSLCKRCPSAALYFQQLPTVKFCNSSVLITIRITGDGGSPSALRMKNGVLRGTRVFLGLPSLGKMTNFCYCLGITKRKTIKHGGTSRTAVAGVSIESRETSRSASTSPVVQNKTQAASHKGVRAWARMAALTAGKKEDYPL